MKTKLAVLFALLAFTACVQMTPQKAAVNSLFTVGQTVNNAYGAYVQAVLAGQVKTNSFPKVTRDYQTFQQLLGLAVSELPGTNGIPGVLGNGAQVMADISLAKKGIP